MSGKTWNLHIKTLPSDFLNLLVPRFCAICGEKMAPGEILACSSCLIKLPYVHISDFSDNIITRLFLGQIPIVHGYSYFFYRSNTAPSEMIAKLKYSHRPDIGRKLGQIIANEISPQGFFEGIDAIVPIPLHWKRWWKRGYNQSEEIAKGISEVTGLPIETNIVRRVRNNVSQTSLSSAERYENVQGLFEANETAHKHILLIDDILTTGSTIGSCAKAILQKSPEVSFSVLTLGKD